ncbi:MAG: VTT domain-containing protein [Gammaproteobacteria bacterium]|nr:VTT domain-containing protein [Gammaproteobacteria bacterium]
MESGWTALLLDWTGDNAGLLLVLVALGLCIESFAVIGVLIPGLMLVFMLGALVALGQLDGWLAWAVASAGCVLGDMLNYWLGRRWRHDLFSAWPLRRYPETIQQGQHFLQRYGGLSLFLGRYLGPLRSFMPVLAGSFGLRPVVAMPVIVFTALSWVALSMLPGILLGASLELAAAYTSRLALLLLLVCGTLLLLIWLVRSGYLLAGRSNPWLLKRMLLWLRRHPRLGRWLLPLFEPLRGELLSVAMLGLLVLTGLAVLIVLSLYLLIGTGGSSVDLWLAAVLQDLRNPVSDAVWVALAVVSTWPCLLTLVMAMALWFALQRQSLSLWHWLIAIAPLPLLAWLLQQLLLLVPLWPAHLQPSHSFPDLNAAMLAATLMALPMLLARELPAWQRKWYYLTVATLLSLLLIARLALGLAWLSALIVAVLLALIWVSLVGIAYRVRADRGHAVFRHSLVFSLLLLLGAVGFNSLDYQRLRAQWRLPLIGTALAADVWRQHDWQRLPQWRSDVARAPVDRLNVQYAGDLSRLQQALLQSGWEPLTATRWWEAFSPAPDLQQLPVYRLGYRGRSARLLLRQRHGEQQAVLRLWSSGWSLRTQTGNGEADSKPLWLGSLSLERPAARAFLFTFWRAEALPWTVVSAPLQPLAGNCQLQHKPELLLLSDCESD